VEKWAAKRKEEITENLEFSQNFVSEHRIALADLQTHLENNIEAQVRYFCLF
jgi:hypothetical protein